MECHLNFNTVKNIVFLLNFISGRSPLRKLASPFYPTILELKPTQFVVIQIYHSDNITLSNVIYDIFLKEYFCAH